MFEGRSEKGLFTFYWEEAEWATIFSQALTPQTSGEDSPSTTQKHPSTAKLKKYRRNLPSREASRWN
jgi:hypothetical protein